MPPPTESVASESVRSPTPTLPPESEKAWDDVSGEEKEEKDDNVKSDWDVSSGEEDETAAAPPAKGE